MATHTITRNYNDGAKQFSYPDPITWAGQLEALDAALATASTDTEYSFAFTKTKLKAIMMVSDQNIRVCTNAASTGSPQETINLIAGKPYLWTLDDGYFACPFAGNVTALYITNVSGATANITIRGLVDPLT